MLDSNVFEVTAQRRNKNQKNKNNYRLKSFTEFASLVGGGCGGDNYNYCDAYAGNARAHTYLKCADNAEEKVGKS